MDSEFPDYLDITSDKDLFSLTVGNDEAGWRLDHFLVQNIAGVSRSQLVDAVKKGAVKINLSTAKASRKLQAGDVISGHIPDKPELKVVPQKIDFEILFEDEYLLLLAKPPYLVVHPANGNPDNTLVNGLVYYYRRLERVGDPIRPGIVHRLDKDTSGVMVVAKRDDVHNLLVEAFKSRQVKKKYLALVSGIPEAENGRIVAAIGRHPVNRKKMAIRQADGKHAASNWQVVRTFRDKYSLVEVEIETGRTHQIRLHMASIGLPVAGDSVYGSKKKDPLFPRQMLHSFELHFTHPITGQKMKGKAPLHVDFAETLKKLSSSGDR